MSGQIISNRYQILQSLGEGGFGQTFLAVDLHLPTKPQCVVKKLQPQATDAENMQLAARLFEQEADVQYRLGSHPNIPSLLAHFEDNGEFYLVQELIVGETLAQELARGKKYGEADAIYLLDQVLETLSFVHQQNVIHRDIKPSNLIRRSSDGKVFLIDFGAVKQVEVNPFRNAASFHSTVAIGSAGYIPSEQAAGKPCFASDLYGLGLVLIQALTGIHPLQLPNNRNTGEFVWQHKVVLRDEVKNFITKLVRYDYRQRWYSAKEAAAAIQLVRTGLGYQKKVEPPRVLQPAVHPQIFQPVIQPQFIQAVAQNPPSEATVGNFTDSKITAPKIEPPLTPTVVQFTRISPPKRLPPNANGTQGKNNDLKIGLFIVVGMFGVLLILGLVSIVAFNAIVADAKKDDYANRQSQNPTTSAESIAFNEAVKLANETDELAKKAVTQNDWQEVAQKYAKAETLLKSISPTDPISSLANQKVIEYQMLGNVAMNKAIEIQRAAIATNTPKIITTTVQPTATPYYTNYPSYPTPTATPAPKKARMPGRRKEKMYLAFSSSTGDYIGQGKDVILTYEDGNFSASVNYHQGATIRFDGGRVNWSLDFAGPQKMRLTPGTYSGAQGFPSQSPTRAGINFSGSGRGCTSYGSFTINNIIYSLDNKNIFLLDASFVHQCEETSPPLMGRIYYDAR
jgi:serine/threonine protein kinase